MTSADMTESPVRWRVGDVLQERGLTAYKLAAELHGRVNRNSVYAIARGETDRVDRGTLGHLITALRSLTGEQYTVGDLLEYTPADPTQPSPGELQAGQALLIPPGKRGRARGLPSPVPVEGPAIEELLNEQPGPEQ